VLNWWKRLCGTYDPPQYFTYLSPLSVRKGAPVYAGDVVIGQVTQCSVDAVTLGYNIVIRLNPTGDFE
jgi:ABC-type transporter Mla subunit MlaD